MFRAGALLGTVGLLALGGAALAALQLLRGEPLEGVVREAPGDGAWRLETGFGQVEVERLQRVSAGGHTAHGAEPGEAADEVRLRVTVGNGSARAVPFSPGQLRLGGPGGGAGTSAIEPRAGVAVMAPGQTLEREVSFLVPETSTRLSLLVDDLVAARPLALRLGEVPSP